MLRYQDAGMSGVVIADGREAGWGWSATGPSFTRVYVGPGVSGGQWICPLFAYLGCWRC